MLVFRCLVLECDKGKALAGQSTLNRLGLSAEAIDARYHKIQPHPRGSSNCSSSVESGIPRKIAEIVLDFDATDDPLHGSQEGSSWELLNLAEKNRALKGRGIAQGSRRSVL